MDIIKNDFEQVIEKFNKKKTTSYDFLLKAAKSYRDVMFKVCKRMIDNVTFPSSVRKTILNMIWKQKGPSDVLKNSRYIHERRVSASDLRSSGGQQDEAVHPQDLQQVPGGRAAWAQPR